MCRKSGYRTAIRRSKSMASGIKPVLLIWPVTPLSRSSTAPMIYPSGSSFGLARRSTSPEPSPISPPRRSRGRSETLKFGEHGVALLAALAAFDPQHHAAGVDVADLERGHFGHPQTRGIGRRQRHARLQAGNGFQKPHHFLRAQHAGKLARLAGEGNPVDDRRLGQGHAVEKPRPSETPV